MSGLALIIACSTCMLDAKQIDTVVRRTPGLQIVTAIVVRPYARAHAIGRIEGSRFNGTLLLQRFSFGWQLIDIVPPERLPCLVTARGIPRSHAEKLNLPLRTQSKNCPDARDRGAATDVVAIRKAMNSRRQAIHRVSVVDRYALAWWYGWGGGQTVFEKRAGAWTQIGNGGGAFRAAELHRLYHVPTAIAAKLLH